jgi:hypothetical protein
MADCFFLCLLLVFLCAFATLRALVFSARVLRVCACSLCPAPNHGRQAQGTDRPQEPESALGRRDRGNGGGIEGGADGVAGLLVLWSAKVATTETAEGMAEGVAGLLDHFRVNSNRTRIMDMEKAYLKSHFIASVFW